MNENIREMITMAVLCILFFVVLTDAVFPFVMFIMKIIFVVCGVLCGIGFLGCISHLFRKKEKDNV